MQAERSATQRAIVGRWDRCKIASNLSSGRNNARQRHLIAQKPNVEYQHGDNDAVEGLGVSSYHHRKGIGEPCPRAGMRIRLTIEYRVTYR